MQQNIVMGRNPLLRQDYPDPDVIRVDDTYYMISTTMHFMPGGVILRSYDLLHWEIAAYVFDTLDDTKAQCLEEEQNIYGKGMWAASLRYHKGSFYVCFVCNDTHKTYLYQSKTIEGKWSKQTIDGFYHDPSLFFDEDDRAYLIYGNRTISITELNEELTAPRIGGLHRVIVADLESPGLSYEGTHFYKIKGRYYAFFIHSLPDRWFRSQACFWSDSLEGEFVGSDILVDDMGYRNAGVAQGGIVDTPQGDWYAILFQDRGGVGRIPVLVPIAWRDSLPVFGVNGKVPNVVSVHSLRPDYIYEPLYTSDNFLYQREESGEIKLKKQWQWNHTPHNHLWSVTERTGALRLYTGKLCQDLTQSYNTLTQRTMEDRSKAVVTIDGSAMKENDVAGISAFLGGYAAVALLLEEGCYYIAMFAREPESPEHFGEKDTVPNELLYQKVRVDSPIVTLGCVLDYEGDKEEASFYYKQGEAFIPIGIAHKMVFSLDHFMGCRFGLFYYAKEQLGGHVDFMNFCYEQSLRGGMFRVPSRTLASFVRNA